MSLHEPTLFDQSPAQADGGVEDISRSSAPHVGQAFRYTDPDTSQAAAESVRESAPNDRTVILDALRACGGRATCDQLRHMLAQVGRQRDRNVVSRRITDLRDRGLVRDSGQRSTKGNGRPVAVWEIVR